MAQTEAMNQTESMDLLMNGPAMEPPPGRQSNFVNPANLNTEGLVLIVSCLIASMLVVSMRMWTKIRLVRRVVLEDWVCCLAQIIFIGFCVVILLSLHHDIGVHQWNIQLKHIKANIPVGQTVRILYCIDLFLIKFAILLQLLRIFVPFHKRNMMFWACHALIWLNFIYYAVYVFLAIFFCNPVKKAYVVGAVMNTASDFSIVVLPQPLIWSLQLSTKRRIGLCAIFLIGLCACAASIVRLRYSVIVIHDEDVTYLAGILNLWAIAEATCGILAMCLPISPKFVKSLQGVKLWSTLKNISLHSFFTKSSHGPNVISKSSHGPNVISNSSHGPNVIPNSEIPSSDEDIAAKSNTNDSHATSLKAYFKKYHYVSTHETELASSVSSKGSSANERNVRANDRGMEIA